MGSSLPLYPSELLPWILGSSYGCPTSDAVKATSIYPSVAFRPLPEGSHGVHRLLRAGVVRLRSNGRLTPLGFGTLQRIPDREVYEHLRGLPRPVRSAFRVSDPRSGFLLPEPLSHLSGPSVHGFHPSESFSLQRAPPLSRLLALLPFTADHPAVMFRLAELQSFTPFEEPHPSIRG